MHFSPEALHVLWRETKQLQEPQRMPCTCLTKNNRQLLDIMLNYFHVVDVNSQWSVPCRNSARLQMHHGHATHSHPWFLPTSTAETWLVEQPDLATETLQPHFQSGQPTDVRIWTNFFSPLLPLEKLHRYLLLSSAARVNLFFCLIFPVLLFGTIIFGLNLYAWLDGACTVLFHRSEQNNKAHALKTRTLKSKKILGLRFRTMRLRLRWCKYNGFRLQASERWAYLTYVRASGWKGYMGFHVFVNLRTRRLLRRVYLAVMCVHL